jgi:hypothetical protein
VSRCLILGSPTLGGGGGISQITSTTLTVTNPTGPVTDIENPGGGSGITRITSVDGTTTVTSPTGPTTDLSTPGNELGGRPVSATAPGSGQVMAWNGSLWLPTNTVQSISNGYGITGATGATPVPAVNLTNFYVDLAGTNFALATGENAIMTSPSLAIGTWMLWWALTIHTGGTAAVQFTTYPIGNTATITSPGASGNPVGVGGVTASGTAGNNITPYTGKVIVQVTSAGTVDLRVYCGAGTASTNIVATQTTTVTVRTIQTSSYQGARIA